MIQILRIAHVDMAGDALVKTKFAEQAQRRSQPLLALEPCLLVRADFNQLYHRTAHQPELNQLATELLSDAFIRNEQREAMLLTCSDEQRYQWLVDNEPDLIQRLPQYHLASYIGVDPVSLSRLKRKLKTR